MAKGHRKTPEEKAAVAKQKRKQRRAKRKKEARDNLTKEEILQDDRFFCISGYTFGGAPYGVTWEEKDLKPWKIGKKMSELPVQSYFSLVTETGSFFAGSKSELISGASSSAVKFC